MSQSLTLVAAETASIQSYIFGSNRLRENVGASYLVAVATEDWPMEIMHGITHEGCNVGRQGSRWKIRMDGPRIEDGAPGEVFYAGGGRFVGAFQNPEHAKAFIHQLSQKVICEAPDLTVVIHDRPYQWLENPTDETESLCAAVAELLADLGAQRAVQSPLGGLAGLSVTAQCDSTTLPAVHAEYDNSEGDGRTNLYSAQVMGKREQFNAANERLAKEMPLRDRLMFPLDFDDLGRSEGESSFIAVVHADGNGMGKLFSSIGSQFAHARQNRDYIQGVRTLSEATKEAAQKALNQTLSVLEGPITSGKSPALMRPDGTEAFKLKEMKDQNAFAVPFRPLVSGGDDVTFVCDGRVALSLAAVFLEQFEHAANDILKKVPFKLDLPHITACAGVAIVGAHYPFARAYELSEELCASAKKMRRKVKAKTGTEPPNALDWHFTTGGLYGDLKEMRERDYFVKGKGRKDRPAVHLDLTLRPVLLDPYGEEAYTWETITGLIDTFQKDWQAHRSKAKDLMGVLRRGEAYTEVFLATSLTNVGLKLPPFEGYDRNGWKKSDSETANQENEKESTMQCGYYDALELMDLYIPLKQAEDKDG